MGITIWSNSETDRKIEKLTGIIIPTMNGDITLNGKKIGFTDSFVGVVIDHKETEDIIKKDGRFCVWNN